MSLAILRSRALAGLRAPEVAVEVHVANGLPAFSLVGLPDAEVREARDRVRAAILCSGFEFPARRITVNLAPADLPKESGRFDLPIALGILIASGALDAPTLDRHEFAGELSLTGALRPVRGALPMALGARDAGRCFVLPAESAAEAVMVAGVDVRAAGSLLDVCAHLCGREALPRASAPAQRAAPVWPDLAMCGASCRRAAHWRSPPREAIRCCSAVRPAPANRCWRHDCPACCPILKKPRRWKRRPCCPAQACSMPPD